jgi:ubiquitin
MSDAMMRAAAKRRMQTTMTRDEQGPVYRVDVQGDGMPLPEPPPMHPDPMNEAAEPEVADLDVKLDWLENTGVDVEEITPSAAAQFFDLSPEEAAVLVRRLQQRYAVRETAE